MHTSFFIPLEVWWLFTSGGGGGGHCVGLPLSLTSCQTNNKFPVFLPLSPSFSPIFSHASRGAWLLGWRWIKGHSLGKFSAATWLIDGDYILKIIPWMVWVWSRSHVTMSHEITSGFWPQLRALAISTPFFLGSLTRKTGRSAPFPPIAASLILKAKLW